ncbi:ParB/RepB/Spo0J family partition protein [Brevibacterium oceani]|uniref:ParB/RepB/Spo0J family partition protein n=1 Tax=Brevibacterium oceani TaxID=358099 RepID=UPI002159D214|nr:ParB/RepB/Spo0J family partition protein [Brevibacterium oceani]
MAESPVEPESAAQTARSVDDGIKGDREARTGSEAESAAVADVLEDVRETHPGVFTSSGHDNTDEAATGSSEDVGGVDTNGAARKKTTDVVSSGGGRSPETAPAAEAPVAATPADSVPGVGESGKDDETGDIDEADDSSASDSTDSDQAYAGVESIPDTEFGEIEVDLIDANPRQPRTVFDEDLLAELVHSIREIGVLQPVVVRQKPSDRSRFELIMGERRLRATKDAGLSTIPAIIRYVEDTDLLRDALLENLHRAELNPLEEAAAYGQLLEDFGCTQEELSERIGRSRPQISNTLRLLRLPPLVQRRVAAGVISAGHARAILGLRDPEHMEVLAQRIVAEGLSVRASEEAVVLLNRGDSINVSRATSKVAPEFLAVAERLGDRLDTKVNISVGKKKGKLSVEFANQEDLDRILGLLGISEAASE